MLLCIMESSFITFLNKFIDTGKPTLFEQGISIAILGIGVVIFSLIILFFCLKLFVRILELQKQHQKKAISVSGKTGKEPITGEIIAAISLAIQQSREEFHDLEKTIITLNRMTKPYSPWSSKIHGIRRPAK